MAVYTKLNFEQINQHLSKYNLGSLLSFQEIVEGIDNSNFIIETESGKFILTIFEGRIDKDSLPYFIDLKAHLAKHKIACPKPILSKNNRNIEEISGKKSVIVSFLLGKTLPIRTDGYCHEITEKHCFAIGEVLSKMHQAALDFRGFKANELGVGGFKSFFCKFSHLIDQYLLGLKNEIDEEIADLEQVWPEKVQGESSEKFTFCAAHLDLFPDNLFFEPNSSKISGIIDFYFAANDLAIYDFAIIVNAWCFDPKSAPKAEIKTLLGEQSHIIPEFNRGKFEVILNGYQSGRNFSASELDFLVFALRAAALRFLLTRLHDLFFTPKNSVVRVKDPLEYLYKFRFFRDSFKKPKKLIP